MCLAGQVPWTPGPPWELHPTCMMYDIKISYIICRWYIKFYVYVSVSWAVDGGKWKCRVQTKRPNSQQKGQGRQPCCKYCTAEAKGRKEHHCTTLPHWSSKADPPHHQSLAALAIVCSAGVCTASTQQPRSCKPLCKPMHSSTPYSQHWRLSQLGSGYC